ncbi:MAG: acyl--CoA ligase [Clostridia bacterium]|nr:acyl--CoA ligase [Clostridia bacterium]
MSSANTPIFPSIDKPWMKHLSKRAKGLQVPEGTMFDQIYENNKDYPNELALKYMDIQVTFAEMWEHIEEVVKALNALGVREGEIITIAMPNTPEFVYLAYAINRVGAVMNIIHPLPGKEELLGYLEEAQSRYFFMFDGTYAIIKDDLKNTSVEKAIVVSPAYSLAPIKRKLYQLAKFPKLDKTMCIDWKAFLKNGVNSPATTGKTDSDAMAVISHTGGTTGEPKGVMLTNRAMNSVAYQVWQTFDLADRRQLTILVVLPPFVNYSFVNGIHEGLTMGDTLALLPEFKPEDFADYYKQYKPNVINSIPQYCLAMLNDPKLKDMDLSELKYVVAGGEAMDATAEAELNAFLKDHGADMQVTKGYGCTEFTSVVTYTYPEVNFLHSVGIPFPFVNVMIVDPDTNEELPCGERGEICVTGPSLMLGYYKNQEATDEVIKVHADGQRWFHMGDLGFVDEDGIVFITGRIKRIIMTKGDDGNVTKMFPDRIENAINKCEDVNASCVVGVKDDERIHYPKVYIELKDETMDKDLAREHILEICRKKLPNYQIPVEIEFMRELPRTERGKIDYKVLDTDSDL